jgi:hypothetical protein
MLHTGLFCVWPSTNCAGWPLYIWGMCDSLHAANGVLVATCSVLRH